MTIIPRFTSNGSVTMYICKICKSLELSGLCNSQEQLPNFSFYASTPVHLVATTKAPAIAKRVATVKASSDRELSTSVTNMGTKSSSNDTLQRKNSSNNSSKNSSNNISNNSRNNNGNNSATSEMEVINYLSDSSSSNCVQRPRS